MADNMNYFSDNEESEWLANFDLSLSHESNEEKQYRPGSDAVLHMSRIEFSKLSSSEV